MPSSPFLVPACFAAVIYLSGADNISNSSLLLLQRGFIVLLHLACSVKLAAATASLSSCCFASVLAQLLASKLNTQCHAN